MPIPDWIMNYVPKADPAEEQKQQSERQRWNAERVPRVVRFYGTELMYYEAMHRVLHEKVKETDEANSKLRTQFEEQLAAYRAKVEVVMQLPPLEPLPIPPQIPNQPYPSKADLPTPPGPPPDVTNFSPGDRMTAERFYGRTVMFFEYKHRKHWEEVRRFDEEYKKLLTQFEEQFAAYRAELQAVQQRNEAAMAAARAAQHQQFPPSAEPMLKPAPMQRNLETIKAHIIRSIGAMLETTTSEGKHIIAP
jgi:hypothetical protein